MVTLQSSVVIVTTQDCFVVSSIALATTVR